MLILTACLALAALAMFAMAAPTVTMAHKGETIDYTPGSAVVAGDVVVLGDRVCVANNDIAANVLGALSVEGVFKFPKTANGAAVLVDALQYWDAANKVAVATSVLGANKLIGRAVLAATQASAFVYIRLNEGNPDGAMIRVTHKLNPANTSGEFAFICDRPYTLIAINEIHNVVAGQACACAVRKITAAGTALADAAAGATVIELLSATIDMTAVAGVTQAGALSAVAGAINLAAGDKICVKMGNGTGLVGGNLTILLQAA